MADTLIGTTIGGYHILKELGQGGMATVYLAHQLSMKREVALKVLPSQFLNQATSLERFKQEASIVARLEHRAIVPVHDYGEHQGMPYLVMRYMDGGSIDDLLAQSPIPPDKTLRIVDQIAPALDYAHRQNVLHRDLKPSNILMDANEDAYLTDFGIARILRPNTKQLTTTGVVGTPSYMSPEQAQGHDLDGRSDVYALGVVIFEMLTGTRPFEGENPYNVAVQHVTATPPSVCEKNPALPRSFEQVLYRALAKNRTLRYQTATELAMALQDAITHPEPIAKLSAAGMVETEPSLNKALEEGAARHRAEKTDSPVEPQPPVMPVITPPEPHPLSVHPSTGAPRVSQSYAGNLVSIHQRRSRRALPPWVTWATVMVLIGSIILAIALSSIYILLNSDTDTLSPVQDYNATAIYKLTATRRAIASPVLATDEMLPILQPTATIPPTNTLRSSSQPGAQ